MNDQASLTIDGQKIPLADEKNLLALTRKAKIEIPTFCYHSELSVYGACRLCLVDIEGMGIVASCSTAPRPGMVVKTQTAEIRDMRKLTIELLLADHHQGCTTCGKSDTCKLLDLARRLGVDTVRFKATAPAKHIDNANPSLVRDPSKCVLCGDCVRFCDEVQGIGAIDFAYRGARTQVMPAFGKGLDKVECVYCGQCAVVCPTGAITPKSEIAAVWDALYAAGKTVVVQIAPAVRVALGEAFGLATGGNQSGRMVAALKRLGFDHVYDACFAADLTVVEEASELLGRLAVEDATPQFTSCCPGWVKFAEQYFPELLPKLSTCRSPQQMFGALAKRMLPRELGVERRNLTVVSVMPCTAKKFEARRPEFASDGVADVDHVITTQELARMIKEAGIRFAELDPLPFDMPMGFKTGAGVLFGNSGGVGEAALRHVAAKLAPEASERPEIIFRAVAGEADVRVAKVEIGGRKLRVAAVYGLRKAREIAKRVAAGCRDYDFIEVMACPGGCVGGAGQPVTVIPDAREQRAKGLRLEDCTMQLHNAHDNPYVRRAYEQVLGEIGGHTAHDLLHTEFAGRRRILGGEIPLREKNPATRVQVNVCVGTSCFLRGSQTILQGLLEQAGETELAGAVAVKATFCHERCERGPVVVVDDKILEACNLATAKAAVAEALTAATAASQ